MKTLLLSILAVVIVLSGGFIYLQLGNSGTNPFRGLTQAGSPTVTTGQGDATKLVFKNYGPAPEFNSKQVKWLNSDPQIMANLKGKVVLVSFWTHSCINCIRAIPYLNQWADKYKDQGLVVLGVHTPQYAFEKVTESVLTSIQRYDIHYPVAQDNAYTVWNGYNNQFWPAVYLVDKEGKVVYGRFGEGNYDLVENAVRTLTGLPGGVAVEDAETNAPVIQPSSQKLLFGRKHIESLQSNELPTTQEQVYTLPEQLRRNAFALEGIWKLSDEKASLTQGYGRIRLSFTAAQVQLAAQSIKPVTLKIAVDGKPAGSITVQAAQDYQLFAAEKSGRHILEIEIPQAGFEASAFIFN